MGCGRDSVADSGRRVGRAWVRVPRCDIGFPNSIYRVWWGSQKRHIASGVPGPLLHLGTRARPTEAAGIAAILRPHPFGPCGCLSWRNHPAFARAGGNWLCFPRPVLSQVLHNPFATKGLSFIPAPGNWLCFARRPACRGNRDPKRDISRLGTRPCGFPPGMGRHGGLPLRCLTGTLPARPDKLALFSQTHSSYLFT